MLKINDVSVADLGISDIIFAGSAFAMLNAQESSNGTLHSYTVETGAPTVGFRAANTGHNNAAGSSTKYDISLKILDATVQEDKAIADVWRNGSEAFMEKRALRNLAQAFNQAEKQFLYGTGNDSDGFVGLVENDAYKYQDSEKVIDGGGSGSAVQSAYIIRSTEDDLSVVYNGDEPMTMGEIYEALLNEYSGGNAVSQYSGYVLPIISWLGLQIGSKHSVVRVANLDLSGTNVEDKIQDGLAEFPEDKPATHILLSKKCRRSIQKARQSYNPYGAPAVIPDNIDGVPLVLSAALGAETAIEDES